MKLLIEIPEEKYNYFILNRNSYKRSIAESIINGQRLPDDCEILTKEAYADLCMRASKGNCSEIPTGSTAKIDVPDNNVGDIDCILRKAVQTRLKEIINEMETIFANIRERELDDSVCGLCEYNCDHGLDGFANECPGFEKDDCFKLNEKYRAEWLDISNLPSLTPQLSSELDKNSKKLEKATTKNDLAVDLISRVDARKAIIDHQYSNSFCEEHNIDHSINTSMALLALSDLPSVTPQAKIEVLTELKAEIDGIEMDNNVPFGFEPVNKFYEGVSASSKLIQQKINDLRGKDGD